MTNDKLTIPDAAMADLPVFPLSQVVLFPNAMLPLHVFEPRYRTMLKDCLATHRFMAVALVPDPADKDESGQPRFCPVAGVGYVVEHHELPDGRSNILLHGRARVRLEELAFVPPYRRAVARVIPDEHEAVTAPERAALMATASAFAADVHQRNPSFSLRLPPNVEAGVLADLSAHHMIIDAGRRQRIFEETNPRERVRLVTADLARQRSELAREGGGAVN
jgi:ATP-dependent Lon protease